jgi:hypothetical protein
MRSLLIFAILAASSNAFAIDDASRTFKSISCQTDTAPAFYGNTPDYMQYASFEVSAKRQSPDQPLRLNYTRKFHVDRIDRDDLDGTNSFQDMRCNYLWYRTSASSFAEGAHWEVYCGGLVHFDRKYTVYTGISSLWKIPCEIEVF